MKLSRSSLVLLMVAIFIFHVGCGSAQEIPNNYELVAANAELSLYMNKDTTEIAVQHHDSQEIWYSNPPGSRSDKDTLSIIYYNPSDEMKRMNNFKDSIEYGQFDIEELENGVRISYLFGPEWWEDDWLPLMIPQDRFENEILPKVPERDRKWLAGKYKLIGLEKMEPDYERVPIAALPNLDKQFGEYIVVSPGKTLSNKDKSTLTLLLVDTVVAANPEKLSERADLKIEHINQLIDTPAYVIDNTIRPWDRSDIIAIMKAIDYRPEEIAKDHIANQIEPPVLNVEVFRITVEYVLEGNSLVVKVPMNEVYYPVQVVPNARYITGVSSYFRPSSRTELFDYFGQIGGQLVDFPLYSINVLNHFGASPTGSEGYIFVPDGSGALVETKVATNVQYARDVYGKDHSVSYGLAEHEYVEPMDRYKKEDLYMPVFGLKEGDKAFFAVIEEGHGMARIKANTSSSVSPYSRVSSEFVLLPYGEINLTETDRTEELARRARGKIKAFPKELPDEDIIIRYTFLAGENANYVGMANSYREYLVQKYNLEKVEQNESNIPFYLELTGAIPVNKSIMGIPRDVIVPLTTYQQVSDIVGKLLNEQVDNIQLRYNGWRQGGVIPGFPNKVRLEKALGSKDDFKALTSYLAENQIGFYPNVDFLNVYDNKYGKFHLRRDIAQSLNRQPIWMIRDDIAWAYVLAPSRIDEVIDRFLVDYQSLAVGGIALGDLGKQINSDFALEKPTSRADSLVLMEEAMNKLKTEGNLELLVNKANIYSVPYADHIVNLPLTSNNYNIISRSVPFYQMVLHEYVNYTGAPLNRYPDYTYAMLKFTETGSLPHFTWMYEEGTTVKQTDFDFLFANYYGDWLDKAAETYHEMNAVLRQVNGQRMMNHQQLAKNVFMTDYENGLSIIVNYNDMEFDYNGVVVAGKSFRLIREGEVDETL